jgi:hypothetical protein
MTTMKRNFGRICLVLTGLVIGLLVAEGLVRWCFPYSRDHVIPAGLFTIDADLGWKLMAGKSVTHHSHHFDVVYDTNILGYRDAPRKLPKEESVYRILLYGDSQIFGWGIPENQRFSNLIEARQSSLEILNLAVPGYGLDQEILSYEKNGHFLSGNEVVLFISKKTLSRTREANIYRKHKPIFIIDRNGNLKVELPPKLANAWTSTLYDLLSPFYLPYFVDRQLAKLKDMINRPGSAPGKQQANKDNVAIGAFEKQLIKRVKNDTVERHHRLTILTDLDEKEKNGLELFCKQNSIGYIAIVLAGKRDDLTIAKEDPHWNVHAHKLIADQISPDFASRIKK